MTNYTTATFMFRKGSDDYTLWVVDLPAHELSKLRRRDMSIHGDLDNLLEQIPFDYGSDSMNWRPYLLMPNRSLFVLYTLNTPKALLREHLQEGLSSRGDKETILYEIAEVHGVCM